jgi:hypothetical protein
MQMPQKIPGQLQRMQSRFMESLMSKNSSRTFLGLRKLPARYAGIVMPLLLSILMTCVVSLVSTMHSVGLGDHLLQIWLSAWGLSWLIAFPTLLLVLPLVRSATRHLVEAE